MKLSQNERPEVSSNTGLLNEDRQEITLDCYCFVTVR
jgi:hypothetical protein